MTRKTDKPIKIGLLASEMCTHGGIQAFMFRLADVLGELVSNGDAKHGYCISLNDNTEALSKHPNMHPMLKLWGGNRSKAALITHTIFALPTIDVLLVGHLGLAPLANALKVLGRIQSYYVILHGIEAWQRVSFLERKALQAATGIIATTRFTATECSRHNHIDADHFHIIPLCTDERSVNPSPNFRLNGRFKLLCVARQDASERYKGFEQIFHALALLKPTYPDIHLNLIGQGNDQPRLKDVVVELGISQQVTFWGALSNEDLAAAYATCDVFTMPSKKEGFGIVFLEAMRWGKPCIGGNHGGTPDVIEHGQSGFLVGDEDISALAEYIQTLADDGALCIKMGKYGQQMVSNKFSKQVFQSAYKSIILK